MKRIAIFGILALLLAGGGVAAWWFYMGPGAETKEAKVVEAPKLTPAYIEFKPFVMPIIHEGEISAHLTIKVTIEIADINDRASAEKKRPRLLNAIITELHSLYHLRLVRELGYDSPLVRSRILKVSEDVIGTGIIGNIAVFELERRQLGEG